MRLLFLLATGIAAADSDEGEWKIVDDHDRWYGLKISGVNSGVMRTLAEKNANGDVRTTEEMRSRRKQAQC